LEARDAGSGERGGECMKVTILASMVDVRGNRM
jgi:hypothetical protein